MRMYSLTTRHRTSGLLLGLAVLGAGVALLLVGVALLATLAVAGSVVGFGVMLYRALRRKHQPQLEDQRTSATLLDPTLEVFPHETTNSGRALPAFRNEQQ
jgi:uncharacterized membrane protein YebE (DUF533 family)